MCLAEIQREEAKVKASIKAAAKRGDMSNAKTLAREVCRSRKAVNRMHTSKAQMNSVVMQMENQLAQRKVTGHLAKSAEVMKGMNRLIKVLFIDRATHGALPHRAPPTRCTADDAGHVWLQVHDISATMQEMQKEMCKAGVIEEMVDDAFEALEEDEDADAADEEVCMSPIDLPMYLPMYLPYISPAVWPIQVERVMTELAASTTSSMSAAPTKAPVQAAAAEEAEEEEEEDMSAMRARLEQIKS